MRRDDYLIARGWRRSGYFASGKARWVDPCAEGEAVYLSEEAAEERQLNRDANVRDYVQKRRPVYL